MHRVRVYTLGCRLNSLESEAVAESFIKNDFLLTDGLDADLYIMNTCTVTSKAEQKARRMLRLFAKNAICIVTGCYAELARDDIEGIDSSVIAISNKEKPELLHLAPFLAGLISRNTGFDKSDIEGFFKGRDNSTSQFDFFPSSFSHHSRALLKVQDGCDRHCSFCRTSIARGLPISLDSDEVVRRVEQLQTSGAKEIVLTGVNLALYSDAGIRLAGLLKKVLLHLNRDVSLRLSSLEPDLLEDEFFSIIQDSHIAPYFHLPLQSLSPRVLSLCGRRYDEKRIDYIIHALREAKLEPFIAADIIAGLPGEEDEDFAVTYDFLKSHELSHLHVFPFSPRPGTVFATAKHPSEAVRDRRAALLRALSGELYASYYQKFVGKKVHCIAEECDSQYQYFTSENYLKIRLSLAGHTPIPRGERACLAIPPFQADWQYVFAKK